ncbi:unnamed protein product [Lampetra fluviatilis]
MVIQEGTVLAHVSSACPEKDVVGSVGVGAQARGPRDVDEGWIEKLCSESGDLSKGQMGKLRALLPDTMGRSGDVPAAQDAVIGLDNEVWGCLQVEDASLLKLRWRVREAAGNAAP